MIFNAHSVFWGDSSSNRRGDILLEGTAELDFRLRYVGDSFACVRSQDPS